MPEITAKLKENAEITIEINPGTIDKDKLEYYKRAGVNRISIGLQSTSNKLLKEIGRIHTYEEFLSGYKLIREVGFKNINIDLMLALPGQTLEVLTKSLTDVINLNPEHISLYSLILEEGTKLYEMVESKSLILPDDDLERQMYWETKKFLETNQYNHYEISNFSKKGYESKHNLNCWEQKEYLGFGTAAHSYYNNIRYSNITDIERYINNIKMGKMKENIIINEEQDNKSKEKEYAMLGLRKIRGINKLEFFKKFKKNFEEIFANEIEELLSNNLIIMESENIKLSIKGIDFANQVWEKFI